MFCKQCGSIIEDNQKKCKYCGAKIDNLDDHNEEHSEQFDYMLKYSNVKSLEGNNLIREFVSKNYDAINNSKFSIPTLFFGPFYFLYRKLESYAFIWLLILILGSVFFYRVSGLIIIVGNIVMAFKFKDIYLLNANNRINNFKQNNKDATDEQILAMCKKYGGTSLTKVILILVPLILIIFCLVGIVSFVVTNGIIQEHRNDFPLKFEVPDNFSTSDYNSDNYLSYYSNSDYEYCHFTISRNSNYRAYNEASDYLLDNVYYSGTDIVSSIETMEINNQKWEYLSVTSRYSTKYVYATIYENEIYEFNYSLNDDDNCSSYYETVLSSFRF